MKLSKAVRRDTEIQRRKNGHRTDNRSVFTIANEQKKRAKKIRDARKIKEEYQEESIKDEL